MAVEIEHKYRVIGDGYRQMAMSSVEIWQGYLSRDKERTVRVRTKGERGYLTVKGLTRDAVRAEYEYEIPYADALEMLGMCEAPVIEKRRYLVDYEGFLWEVDEFKNVGDPEVPGSSLVVAEIELPSSDISYPLPPFVGQEVTSDPRYYNSNLLAYI